MWKWLRKTGGTVFFPLIVICLVFAASGTALSEDPGEEIQGDTGNTATVRIDSKTTDNLLTDRGIFRVDEMTVFYDEDGKKMSFSLLPVPCKAEISYESGLGDPEARSVKLIKALPGAVTYFQPPTPE
ncbi:MAG: hypothetical protein JRH13_05740 [Deltaproteobacteria bacterium]|nr:hypothetical protein [Deltaproteobacteria bacterium]MBW2128847.1 hypothetical protein [Deltaproteobacteria bacterium]MBW2302214.1 hypothetical protein [Deltaproteobacteria bacterium]